MSLPSQAARCWRGITFACVGILIQFFHGGGYRRRQEKDQGNYVQRPPHIPSILKPRPSSHQISMRSGKTSVSWFLGLIGSIGSINSFRSLFFANLTPQPWPHPPIMTRARHWPPHSFFHFEVTSISSRRRWQPRKSRGFVAGNMGQTSLLLTLDNSWGHSRLLRFISKTNEGVLLTRFDRRKRYVWGAIERHFVICWLDWVAEYVLHSRFWFRILEVLTKNWSYPNRSRLPLGTASFLGLRP